MAQALQPKTIARVAARPAPTPVRTTAVPARVQLQSAIRVSSPKDPAEKEAEMTAKRIMRMAAPEPAVASGFFSPYAGRFADAVSIARAPRRVARKSEGQPDVGSNVTAELSSSLASGNPLTHGVRRFMEPRFRADFSNVRIHAGNNAAQLNKQFSAQAFAYGNQIYFGKDKFKAVYIPKAFTLVELVKFVFSVLGISWGNIRPKLVTVLGDNVVKALETGFDVVVTLVTQGPAAAWDKIKEHLANLRDTVIGGIIDMVVDAVVKKAVPKLVAMFIPGAGFLTAIISIYDTVMVFVQKISKIIQVVTAFIDSIVAIAGGNIGAAAARVEKILAGLLSLAITFLAGFAGLGKVADKLMGVIGKVRTMVDKAIDALIAWIVMMAKKLFSRLFGKKEEDKRTDAEKKADLTKALKEAEALQRKPGVKEAEIQQGLPAIKSRYKMTALDLVVDSKDKGKEKLHVKGKINPEGDSPTTEVADDVMKLVKADVASAPQDVNAGSLGGWFDQEMAAHGPLGLQSLELQPESEMVAAIVGSASPATILEYVVANNIPLPDYGYVTAVVAIDNGRWPVHRRREVKHERPLLLVGRILDRHRKHSAFLVDGSRAPRRVPAE